MKLQLLSVALAFLFGYLCHEWLGHSKQELRAAHQRIEEESVASAMRIAVSQNSPEQAAISKNVQIVDTSPPTGVPRSDLARKPANLSSAGQSSEETSFLLMDTNHDEFWCQPVKGDIDPDRGVCTYSEACKLCKGSRVLVPETPGAEPFCTQGGKAISVSPVCCAKVNSGVSECTGVRDCLQSNQDLERCRG